MTRLNKSIYILLPALLLHTLYLGAQNQFGALHSNYTPTNSVFINPSSMLDAKTWLDINIVGVGAYANNNLVAAGDNHAFRILSEQNLDEESLVYAQGRKRYAAFTKAFVLGPSAVWSQGDHAAGLALQMRSYTAAQRVPTYFGPFIENGVAEYTPQHGIDYSVQNLRVASLNFGEIQGSYAYTFLKHRRNMLMGGVSLKKFFSIAGGAANVYDFDFNVLNDSVARIYQAKADAMYTDNPRFNPGGGFGMDIGFTFQKMLGEASSYYPNSPKMGCRYLPYKYKIGVSVIDIGSVKFDPDDLQYVGYNFENYTWYNYNDPDIDEDNATDIFINQESDPENGEVKNPQKISLPTFFSVQADYNLWASRVYVNATLVQGIPHGKRSFGIRHANSLALTPRYESKWIDFALPFSLYEYRYAQLGASLRIAYFTIGTDKLIDLFFDNKMYGSDIYVYVKIPFFYHPKCRSKLKRTDSYNPGFIKRRSHPCDAYN